MHYGNTKVRDEAADEAEPNTSMIKKWLERAKKARATSSEEAMGASEEAVGDVRYLSLATDGRVEADSESSCPNPQFSHE